MAKIHRLERRGAAHMPVFSLTAKEVKNEEDLRKFFSGAEVVRVTVVLPPCLKGMATFEVQNESPMFFAVEFPVRKRTKSNKSVPTRRKK